MDRHVRALLVEDSEEDTELVTLALGREGLEVTAERVDTRQAMEHKQVPVFNGLRAQWVRAD